MGYLGLIARCLIGAVFAASAFSKLRSGAAYRAYASWLGGLPVLPARIRSAAAPVLAGTEVAIPALIAMPWTAVVGLLLAAAALAAFGVGTIIAIRRGARALCHCFGPSSTPLGPRQVLRDMALCAVAVAAAITSTHHWSYRMNYLAAVIIVTGVLCLLNTALTVGILMWLRRQRVQPPLPMHARPSVRLPAGATAPEFAITTIRGELRTLDGMRGALSLIGFLSPHCPPCLTEAPEFAELARRIGGYAHTLAILIGDEAEVAELRTALDGVAAVALETRRGPVATAFAAAGFPTFYLIDAGGTIMASGAAARMVAAPVPA
jgi:thiol-disulfide isomerase/thioredoxin